MEKSYRWSSKALSLHDLYKKHRNKKALPQLIQVVEGYQGSEDYCSFGHGEVILVTAVLQQKRVVLKNEKNKILSFSLHYARKFYVLAKDEQLTELGAEPHTLQEITTKIKSVSGLKLKPKHDTERDLLDSFPEYHQQFNSFTVVKISTESYFVGHTVSQTHSGEETVGEILIPLPLHIPITVTTAEGLAHGSDTALTAKLKTMAHGKQTQSIKWTTNNGGVLMYGEGVDERSEYEALRPAHVMFDLNYQKVLKDRQSTGELYSEIPHASQKTQHSLPCTNQYASVELNEAIANLNYMDITSNFEDIIPPTIPVKTPPKVLLKPTNRRFVHVRPSRDINPENQLTKRRDLPPIPTTESEQIQFTTVSTTENEQSQTTSLSNINTEQLQNRTAETGQQKTTRECIQDQLADVPESVSGLSIQQVTLLLRHWKLGHHADTLADQQVDGDLLLELTEKEFIDEFAFTSFEAKKLILFARNPRRPDYKLRITTKTSL